jgi:quinoprotein glucose dehydrogenase
MLIRNLVLAAAAALLAAPVLQTARAEPPAGDWPMYSRDEAGTRYSPLKQINTGNVSQLTAAWTLDLAPPRNPNATKGRGRGGRGGFASAATPIVVNGVMYLPAGNRVLALEADSGKEIWQYHLDSGQASTRGVAYWPGDKQNPPRVIFTSGRSLIAINAKTGKIDPGFGNEGAVDMVVPYSGVPTIYKNIVMVGASVGEVPKGPPGNTRAYDARTGAKMWEFHSVAQPGEVGHDTWLNDGWKNRSGVNVWAWYMTVDEQRGILYMPIGGPAANYWGGDRPGANLFANSTVAVDAKTGKYLWHFQTVHHDLWDSDNPPAPGLIDITKDGKKIPILAQVGKTGWMFILNRVTGKPVFGVEERPVPKGDVPGEWYSPTQPFPLKPPALARVSFKKDDMVTAADTTPEHVKACEALWDHNGGFVNEGPFTPWLFHKDGDPPKSTIQFPGGTGGINWGGTASDPKTGYIFMNSHDGALTGWIEKKKPGENYGRGTEGSDQPYDRASVDGPGPYHGFSATVRDANGKVIGNWPCQKPPWARLIAVNANTGDIAWQVPLGLVEGLPEGKQNAGSSGSAGPSATAGGLVFIGATNDSRFRAFDSMTGKELWVTKLPRSANANPMIYQGKNGKEYVAIVAGDTVHVFGLPK